ncbi:hypothetical protein NKH69_05760 [Mesorhizobium sp. M0976]|uniref:hypothetical protein n=1 Tax=Mesorhizobium sp. M0976 TaxID=2957038 RepID=UPI00333AF54E
MAPKAKTASGTRAAEFPLWRRDNLIFLNIIKNGFNLKTGAQVADFLGTCEAAVSRTRKGVADIAGLAPAVLGQLYPGVSEIALQAQLKECDLRKLHAQKTGYLDNGQVPPEDLCENLSGAIADGWWLLSRLRERYNDFRNARTAKKILERRNDRASMRSLEGQLFLYGGNYTDAADAFRKGLSHFDLAEMSDLGSRVLLVRMTINWWFSHDMIPAGAVEKEDVSLSLTEKEFVRIACDVAFLTGDSRLLINVSEAHAGNRLNDPASKLLCDAAEILDITAADLPRHRPVGYGTPLAKIPAFTAALGLAIEVEARRRDAREKKSAARRDVSGIPLDSLPDDATLHLPGI